MAWEVKKTKCSSGVKSDYYLLVNLFFRFLLTFDPQLSAGFVLPAWFDLLLALRLDLSASCDFSFLNKGLISSEYPIISPFSVTNLIVVCC